MAKQTKASDLFSLTELNSYMTKEVNSRGSLVSENKVAELPLISTGIYALDALLSGHVLNGGISPDRFIGIGGESGTGKCVRQDTLVPTSKGMVYIKDLHNPGDGATTDLERVKVAGVFKHELASVVYKDGHQKCHDVSTQLGLSIGGSSAHRIMVWDVAKGEMQWKYCKDVSVGDIAVIRRGSNLWASSDFMTGMNLQPPKSGGKWSNFNDVSKETIDVWPESADLKGKVPTHQELAYFVGLLVGDGHVANGAKGAFSVAVTDPDIKQAILQYCEKTHLKHWENGGAICFSNVAHRDALLKYGVGRYLAAEKHVPVAVMQSTKEVVFAFLRGLFDADAGVSTNGEIEYSTVSKRLATEVQALLLNAGIVSRLSEKQTSWTYLGEKKYGSAYRLMVTGNAARLYQDLIGFGVSVKRDKLLKALNKPANTNLDVYPVAAILAELDTQLKAEKLPSVNSREVRANHSALSQCMQGKTGGIAKQTLERYLDQYEATCGHLVAFNKLRDLCEMDYYFDVVVTVSEGEDVLYDFVVPGSNSFAGNGFVNHNTYLTLNICRHAQKAGYFIMYIDSEGNIKPSTIEAFGLDPTMIRVDPVRVVEQFKIYMAKFLKKLQEAKAAGKEIPKILVALDSIGNLASRKEIEDAESGESKVDMTRAKQLKSIFRIITAELAELDIPLVATNHTYWTQEMYPKEIFSGGTGAIYNASTILMLGKAKLKSGEEDDLDLGQSGIVVTAKTQKNRMAKPKKIKFEISFVSGANPYKGLEYWCTPENFQAIGIAKGKFELNKATGELEFKPGGNNWAVRHLGKSVPGKHLHSSTVFTPSVIAAMEPVLNEYFRYNTAEDLEETQKQLEELEEKMDDANYGVDAEDFDAADLF